ncbi:periplasmic binding protein-like I [Paraphysoderma sedebokerense]|nr:periplasmic binding protein-like I [Paraphysoderma sedebokerense]
MARPTFILATLLWAVLFSSVANAQTEIKIGVFLPNTTAMSGIVTSIWNALTLYAEEVNNSTLLPNATVVLSFKDTQLSKALGVSYAVSYAKDDGMFATIGETSSRITIPSALALNQFKVFQCSGSATNAELSSKADYPYFFRTLASDNVQGVVLAKYVKFMNWTQIAMITVNDEYGLGLAQSFQEEASKLSLTIVSNVLYTPRSVNFTANVLQLKDSGARIFLVFGHNDCGAEFENCGPELMITAKRHGLVGEQYVWIGAEAFYATIGMVQNRTQYGQDYRDAVNGMLAAFPLENPKTQTSNNAVAQYRQRFGSDPAPYTLFFRDCLASYVHGIKNLLQKNTSLTLAEILNRPNSTIDALKFVNGLQFEGASGTVVYDSHADRSGKYAIINNYDSSEKVVFAYNAITDEFETLENLRFYDGSANIPSDVAIITPLVVSWNDPGVAVLVALHSVMILVVMGSIAALFRHRNSKNVKALSLNMVYLIAAGVRYGLNSLFDYGTNSFADSPHLCVHLCVNWCSYGSTLSCTNVASLDWF